jgi:sensory rhodopsin
MTISTLRGLLDTTFLLTFIAFVAGALFLYLERDRVPERFRTVMRVSCVYLVIASINYFYMKQVYGQGLAAGMSKFPTQFRYIDWILTTPLMLLKFPLMLGIGKKGRSFMIRLVVLDLVMILGGYVGELNPLSPALHHGSFLVGCLAWFGIVGSLFQALSVLPPRIGPSVRSGVRTMGMFLVFGWAVYPVGYFAPMLGVPDDVRELIYNIADAVNKLGLCLIVYSSAKSTAKEEDDAAAAEAEGTEEEESSEEEDAEAAE